jgi:excisionase family DNA binding protein
MAIDVNGIKAYTVQEVAQALKVTPPTVRKFIKEKRIKAIRVGVPYYITEQEIKKFMGVE